MYWYEKDDDEQKQICHYEAKYAPIVYLDISLCLKLVKFEYVGKQKLDRLVKMENRGWYQAKESQEGDLRKVSLHMDEARIVLKLIDKISRIWMNSCDNRGNFPGDKTVENKYIK